MQNKSTDKYQQRYLEHQEKKKSQLIQLMKLRYSERIFNGIPVSQDIINIIYQLIDIVPSSCNRKAIKIINIDDRDSKQLLGGLLVGGAGWIHRAGNILLFLADNIAYKEDLHFMPYLDAGFLASSIYYFCTENNIGCCYVNPNIRSSHYHYFQQSFNINSNIFCGACAIGHKENINTKKG